MKTAVCLILLAASAHAATHRVGSLDEAGALKLRPGDRVEFAAGSMLFGNLTVRASGTAEAPIVIAGAGGERAQLCNPEFANDCGRVIDVRGSHVVIENLAFFDGPVPPPDKGLAVEACGAQHRSVTDLGAVFIDAAAHHVTVRNCTFDSCPIGIRVRGCDCQIVSNRLENAGKITERWGAIAVAMTGSRLVLAENVIRNYGYLGGFFDGDGAAFEVDGEDPSAARPVSDITIRRNRSEGVKGGFLEVTRGDVKNLVITDNFSDDQDKFAGFWQLADGVRIERNTIVRRRAPLRPVFWGATTNAVCRDNRLLLAPDVAFDADRAELRRTGYGLGFTAEGNRLERIDGARLAIPRFGVELADGPLKTFRDGCRKTFAARIDPSEHVVALTEVGAPLPGVLNARPEFAGHYLDLCATYWERDGLSEARAYARKAVSAAAAGMTADGYLGGEYEDRRRDYFSLWNQAHVVYGLARCAKAFDDPEAKALAVRAADWLMKTWDELGVKVVSYAGAEGCQHLAGLYSFQLMYDLTGDWKYLVFVGKMLDIFEKESKMKLLSAKGCLDLPSRKGIEMLNGERGLLGFGRHCWGRKDAIEAAGRYWRSIADTQVGPTGASTAKSPTEKLPERFTQEGNAPRLLTADDMANENCVQCGWMRFTREYFGATHEPRCADELERTLYNHTLGSVASDGSDFAYYQPNVGKKVFHKNSYYQCCRYRGFAVAAHLPELVLDDDGSTVTPLVYAPLAYAAADGFRLDVRTDYPANGRIVLTATAGKGRELNLRVPAWCAGWTVKRNGLKQDAKPVGGFLRFRIDSAEPTEIVLELKMEFKAKPCTIGGKGYAFYTYGPLALVRDTHDGDRLGEPLASDLDFKKVPARGSFVRFEAKDATGRVHALVDFASACRRAPDTDEFELYVPTSDAPRFAWRGYMLDVSRHFFTADEVKRALDAMHAVGLNVFHWHLTDGEGWRLPIDRYPKLMKKGYTKDEIRDIVKYAAVRDIRVIPEIDIPGHSSAAIEAYPELKCTGGWNPGDLCPGKDTTIEMYENILLEVMELFPDKVIHLGGDECSRRKWRTCPDCQARIRKHGLRGEKGLQGWFAIHFAKFLEQHGRRMAGWDEIAEFDDMPKSAIVMAYRDSARGLAAAKKGFDVVFAPCQFCYLDYVQGLEGDPYEYQPFGCVVTAMKIAAFDPLAGCPAEARHHVLGGQANLWTELVPDWEGVEWRTWPRLAAIADVLRNGPEKDAAAFAARLEKTSAQLKAMGVKPAPLGPLFKERPDLASGARYTAFRPDFAKLGPTELDVKGLCFDWNDGANRDRKVYARYDRTIPSGGYRLDLDWMRIEAEASDLAGFTNAVLQLQALARTKRGGVREFPACRIERGEVPPRRIDVRAATSVRAYTNAVGQVMRYRWKSPRHAQLGLTYPVYVVLGDKTGEKASSVLTELDARDVNGFLVAPLADEPTGPLAELLEKMKWEDRTVNPDRIVTLTVR